MRSASASACAYVELFARAAARQVPAHVVVVVADDAREHVRRRDACAASTTRIVQLPTCTFTYSYEYSARERGACRRCAVWPGSARSASATRICPPSRPHRTAGRRALHADAPHSTAPQLTHKNTRSTRRTDKVDLIAREELLVQRPRRLRTPERSGAHKYSVRVQCHQWGAVA